MVLWRHETTGGLLPGALCIAQEQCATHPPQDHWPTKSFWRRPKRQDFWLSRHKKSCIMDFNKLKLNLSVQNHNIKTLSSSFFVWLFHTHGPVHRNAVSGRLNTD